MVILPRTMLRGMNIYVNLWCTTGVPDPFPFLLHLCGLSSLSTEHDAVDRSKTKKTLGETLFNILIFIYHDLRFESLDFRGE